MFSTTTVNIKDLTPEMINWLKLNVPKENCLVQQRTVRIRYSGGYGGSSAFTTSIPRHPEGNDYTYDGWQIEFKDEEHAVLFKLTFQDEIG